VVPTLIWRSGAHAPNPQVRISHDALDTDPMLLQVINGTIDLRTGSSGVEGAVI